MKFNETLAIELLCIIENIPSDVLLNDVEKIHSDILNNIMLPKPKDNLSTEKLFEWGSDVLVHLYILSNSGLIHPPMDLQTLRNLKEIFYTGNEGYLFKQLPLTQYTLTVQGYDYLERKRSIKR